MKTLLISHKRIGDEKITGWLHSVSNSCDIVSDRDDAAHLLTSGKYDICIESCAENGSAGQGPCLPSGRQLPEVPTVKYCARCSGCDLAQILDAGFDDHFSEPLSFTEFAAKLRALYRRKAKATPSFEHRIGDLYLNSLTRLVTRSGNRLPLQRRAFQILEYMMERQGHVISKPELLDRVWDYNFNPSSSVVETQVSRLRQIIDKPYPNKLIHTYRGLGYQIAVEPTMSGSD